MPFRTHTERAERTAGVCLAVLFASTAGSSMLHQHFCSFRGRRFYLHYKGTVYQFIRFVKLTAIKKPCSVLLHFTIRLVDMTEQVYLRLYCVHTVQQVFITVVTAVQYSV